MMQDLISTHTGSLVIYGICGFFLFLFIMDCMNEVKKSKSTSISEVLSLMVITAFFVVVALGAGVFVDFLGDRITTDEEAQLVLEQEIRDEVSKKLDAEVTDFDEYSKQITVTVAYPDCHKAVTLHYGEVSTGYSFWSTHSSGGSTNVLESHEDLYAAFCSK